MLRLFGRRQPRIQPGILISFDPAYDHMPGAAQPGKVHKIPRGTTDLTLYFPAFEEFEEVYINKSTLIPADSLKALQQGSADFAFMVTDGGEYLAGWVEDGGLDLRVAKLRPINGSKPLAQYEKGTISLGIRHVAWPRFDVLWATKYEAE